MDRFDHLYMTIAKEAGGIEGLLNSFFSFLFRRTDFFYEADPTDKMGFPPGVNERMLLTIFKQFQEEYYKKVPKKSPEEYKTKLEAMLAKQKETKTEKITQDPVPPAPIQNNPEINKPAESQEPKSKPQAPINIPQQTNEAKEPAKVEIKPSIIDKDDKYNDIR